MLRSVLIWLGLATPKGTQSMSPPGESHIGGADNCGVNLMEDETANAESVVSSGVAPEAVAVRGRLIDGIVEIMPSGTKVRLQFTASQTTNDMEVIVVIERERCPVEILKLCKVAEYACRFLSDFTQCAPHGFNAVLRVWSGKDSESIPFKFVGTGENAAIDQKMDGG